MSPKKIFKNYREFCDFFGKYIEKLDLVTTTGVFDILHPGHIDFLDRAAKLGGDLIVLIDSDEMVRVNKGKTRPVNNLLQRCRVLAGLSSVKYIVPFKSKEDLELALMCIAPKYHVKDQSYLGKNIIGSAEVFVNKGSIVFLPMQYNYSTTEIIKRIKKS